MLEHLRHKPKSSQSTHTTVPISNIGGQILIQAFEIEKGQSMGENNLVHLNDIWAERESKEWWEGVNWFLPK